MITNGYSGYMAQLLEAAGGFVCAVGRGAAAWGHPPPPPNASATGLEDERARVVVPPEDVAFLDDNGGVADGPTPRIQLTATLSGIEGPLREIGWFAGGTEAPGSGTLLVIRRHQRVEATASLHLTRTVRLDLRGAGGTQADARYLGNTRTGELHDLQHLTANCQLDEIRVDHRYGFERMVDALAMGYDRCAYCFSREQSTR